jgi:hypothetical protein
MFDVILTDNFQYQSQLLPMRVTNWPNIVVNQGQFSDTDLISATHQRENVQYADKLQVSNACVICMYILHKLANSLVPYSVLISDWFKYSLSAYCTFSLWCVALIKSVSLNWPWFTTQYEFLWTLKRYSPKPFGWGEYWFLMSIKTRIDR